MDEFKAILVRVGHNDFQTRGNIIFYRGNSMVYRCQTLELPWKNNERGVSCITEGNLIVRKVPNHYKFGNCFQVFAPQRSEVMIHPGNFTSEIRGCILPGDQFVDINKDGHLDIANSRAALAMLFSLAPNEFTLKIVTL